MNRCTAHMAADCTLEGVRTVYLDGVEKGVWACEPCVSYAARVGMNPVADRRSVARIPEWRRRSLAKIMDHGARVA